jgi:hypothetical protein
MRAPALLAAVALTACSRLTFSGVFGGVRPLYGPVPGSLALQLDAQPAAVIVAATREVRAAGLDVARVAANEGYLESQWYDVGTHRSVTDRARDLDRVVKLRFFADPTAGKTHLAAECVRRIADDPSEPERYWERMVPDSTPGRVLLDSIVGRLKVEFPPPAPAPGTSPGP